MLKDVNQIKRWSRYFNNVVYTRAGVTYAPFLYPQECMTSTNSDVFTDFKDPEPGQEYYLYPVGTGKLKHNEHYKHPTKKKITHHQRFTTEKRALAFEMKVKNKGYDTKLAYNGDSKRWELEYTRLIFGHQSSLENDLDAGYDVDYVLVSHGEPKENCGKVRAKRFCVTTEKFLHDLLESCDRATCPICWSNWVERETKVATEKFLAGLRLLRLENTRFTPYHFVFSVPPSEYHYSGRQLRTRLNYRLRWLGAIASCVIYHPFRFRNVVTKEQVSWRHCSLNRNAVFPVIESEPYFSPHFHCAVIGYLKKSSDFHERFQWIYKKIDNRPLDNEDRFRGFMYYALSHSAIKKQQHAVTWTGRFGTNSMIIERIETEQVFPPCKCCGGLTKIVYQVDIGDYIEKGQTELYSILVTKRHYKFKECGNNGT